MIIESILYISKKDSQFDSLINFRIKVWWFLGWLRSWLYGPSVTLHDCLAAFFSADELKGDNMYR